MAKSHIAKEKETIALMINIYCQTKEGNKHLCPSCQELLRYAKERLNNCRFGENKCSCKRCPAPCYRPDMKNKIREVMRYAGPRMPILSPVAFFRYLVR